MRELGVILLRTPFGGREVIAMKPRPLEQEREECPVEQPA
jgi:hypothetical protein